MMINDVKNISTSFQAKAPKKLIPIAKYKGPLLKLTTKEEEQIAQLKKQLAYYECEYFALQHHLANKKIPLNMRDYYNDKYTTLQRNIDSICNEIQEIKANRHKIQMNKSKS